MTLRIIGINLSHDSSACLVEDGRIRAALALERTTRVKRGVVPLHAYAPAMADLTHQLLVGAGVGHADIDYWIVTSTESRDERDERLLATTLGLLAPPERCLSLPHPGHHLAHASSAFYSSGFASAAALVIDAYGSRIGRQRERETGFLFGADGPPRTVLRTVRDEDRIAGREHGGALWIPGSLSGIGEVYRVVTLALGFSEPGTTYDDAGKTMGLAAYGKRFSDQDLFMHVGPDGIGFDRATDSLVELGLAVRQEDGLRLVTRAPGTPLRDFHRNLAAQVQAEFEEACLYLTREVLAHTGTTSLVAAGGCFLNSVLNTRILAETDAERLFVFPAATDDGNAAGAALYAHHVLVDPQRRGASPARRTLTNVYFGPPRVTGCDVAALAALWGLPAEHHASPAALSAAAAAAIGRGEMVGWFQDRAEFGPRSLGARSILCHPGLPGMKDRLNARVKFREPFRPFAASVLAEHAVKWFEMPAPESPFMLLVCPVVTAQREIISEVVHADGTCRVQTVEPDQTGPFRSLLEVFEEQTGLPMVLNTSFNLRGMPIVETPEQALDCLYGSRLDRLFLGEYEIVGPEWGSLHPVRGPITMQATVVAGQTGPLFDRSQDVTAAVVTAAGRRHRLSGRRLWLLDVADGHTSVDAIAAQLGWTEGETIDELLELRRFGLVRWAGVPELAPPPFPLPQYDPQASA